MAHTTLNTEDRIALHELIARYSHLLDRGGIDRMGEIFTDDCHFTVAHYDVDIHGLPALIGFFHATMATVPHVRHIITNVFTEITDTDTDTNSANMHAYLHVVDAATNAITAVAAYHDRCIKTDAGWRIAIRNVTTN